MAQAYNRQVWRLLPNICSQPGSRILRRLGHADDQIVGTRFQNRFSGGR